MTGMATVLKQVPYFASLGTKALEALAREVRRREYRTGSLVIAEGEPCDGLPFVIRGRVKLFKAAETGREQILRIIGPGRTFNDVPVFDDGGAPASVAALEPTVIGTLPTMRLIELIRTDPSVALAVARTLATRMRAMTQMIEDLALRGVTARVAKMLLACSQGRPLLAEGAGNACSHLTQQNLATMTGSVREVVQRALKTLEREGAIEMSRGRIRVVEPAVLETWAKGEDIGDRNAPPRIVQACDRTV
jgi:CRP/FNR family transcriptional regulator